MSAKNKKKDAATNQLINLKLNDVSQNANSVSSESKDLKVAKMTLKQGILVATITGIITLAVALVTISGNVVVALIGKPTNSFNSQEYAQHIEVKSNLALEQFEKRDKELNNVKKEIQEKKATETNPENLKKLEEAEAWIDSGITHNRDSQKSVQAKSTEMIKQGSENKIQHAEIIRSAANEVILDELKTQENVVLRVNQILSESNVTLREKVSYDEYKIINDGANLKAQIEVDKESKPKEVSAPQSSGLSKYNRDTLRGLFTYTLPSYNFKSNRDLQGDVANSDPITEATKEKKLDDSFIKPPPTSDEKIIKPTESSKESVRFGVRLTF